MASGFAFGPGDALHQRQVSAGRAAADADPLRVDLVIRGVVADVAHGAVHVLQHFGNGELRLAAMHDGEHGVAALEQLLHKAEIDRLVRGEPAAADAEDHRRAVGLRRLEDVHRQRRAELAAVDHVLGPFERRLVTARAGGANRATTARQTTADARRPAGQTKCSRQDMIDSFSEYVKQKSSRRGR